MRVRTTALATTLTATAIAALATAASQAATVAAPTATAGGAVAGASQAATVAAPTATAGGAVAGASQAATVAAPTATAGGAVAGTSPATPPVFRVLHDDRIGALSLPAGNYTVTPFGGMSAAQASQRFTRFLQDYDGKLPAPWTLNVDTATFSRGAAGFTVAPAPADATPSTTTTGTVCAGVFEVEHNDRIGPLRFPAGDYQVTSLRGSCTANMNAFRRLLARGDDRLPSTWALAPQTGTFSTAAGPRFRVKQR